MNAKLIMRWIAAVAFTGAFAGAEKGAPEYDRAAVREGAEFAAYLAELRPALAVAEEIQVWEGLPHPVTERELLARERKERQVVVLHDAGFYAGPGSPDAKQQDRMAGLLSGTLSEYAGDKRCAGFHADYAVTWKSQGREWSALFCYGCGEAAIFGAPGSLKCDLNGPAGKAWRAWLAQFDRLRPRAR